MASFESTMITTALSVWIMLITLSDSVTKQFRLPPQVAFAGKTTRIHLGEHFKSEHDAELTYMVMMFDDDQDPPVKMDQIPEWVEWDATIPSLHILPPSNLSQINPVYEFRVLAMTDNDKEELAEEQVIVVVAHSCFNTCPNIFGLHCENWDYYMNLCGLFGVIMLSTGIMGHCIIATVHDQILEEKRRKMVNSQHLLAKMLEMKKMQKAHPEMQKEDYDREWDRWEDDDDDVWYPKGKPKEFDCWKSTTTTMWNCYLYCCCVRSGDVA